MGYAQARRSRRGPPRRAKRAVPCGASRSVYGDAWAAPSGAQAGDRPAGRGEVTPLGLPPQGVRGLPTPRGGTVSRPVPSPCSALVSSATAGIRPSPCAPSPSAPISARPPTLTTRACTLSPGVRRSCGGRDPSPFPRREGGRGVRFCRRRHLPDNSCVHPPTCKRIDNCEKSGILQNELGGLVKSPVPNPGQ